MENQRTEASSFSYQDPDLNDLRTGRDIKNRLTDLYAKFKESRAVNNSFSKRSSILLGRDEFFVKPPVGMGYSMTVEGSTNKLIQHLESKFEDEYHDKDAYVNESIISLADGFEKSVKNYVDNRLASEVREKVKPYLEEAKEKLIKDYEEKLANEIIKPGLKEFDKKFAEDFESYLDQDESEKWRALIESKKDNVQISKPMKAFKNTMNDKYRQLEYERLSKIAEQELEKYMSEYETSRINKLKEDLEADYTKKKVESTIKKFYKIIMP